MFRLDGLKAVVTGASRGIGRTIAEKLSAQGAELVLSATKADSIAELAASLPTKAHALACNLKDSEAIQAFTEEAEKTLGQVDIIINNAGITADNLLMRMKDEEWDDVMQVNLRAVFQITRAFTRGMMRKKFGRIINISSVVGVTGNAGQSNYVASKAGVIGFSKSLAMELATRNITVNCVAPGFIASDMTEKLSGDQKDAILRQVPMGVMGDPEDIAAAVAYLASREAKYVTGTTLHVNGGMAMI